ncbi:hypothetical protein [Zoogloea sp.]|uniref:hypothetical protein n=1 Tax=Zoogloea sp. TaxID=49181 RepID=UPI0035B0F2C3
MNFLHAPIHWSALFHAVLDWIADTTRQSRSARLSTLGLSAYDRDGDGFEHPADGPGCR